MVRRRSSSTSLRKARSSAASPLGGLTESVVRLENYARTAKKNGFKLSTHAFYSSRAWDGLADARRNLLLLKEQFGADPVIGKQLASIEGDLNQIDFSSNPASMLRLLGMTKFRLKSDVAASLPSPQNGRRKSEFLPAEILPNGVYRRVLDEVNQCYEMGCYNAAAGMLRRLIESLIIDAFEAHTLGNKIMVDGEYQELKALIGKAVAEQQLRLGRNTKDALPKMKFFGDMGLHSRRNLVREGDLKRLHSDVRVAIEELATHLRDTPTVH